MLGYYDHWITQQDVNEELRPFPSPCRIAQYINEQYRYYVDERNHYGDDPAVTAHVYNLPRLKDGDETLPLRLLVANGVPVIVMQELSLELDIGHYRIIKGYEDETREFILDDPLLGSDHRIPYDIFPELMDRWHSRRAFIPVFPPHNGPLVESWMAEFGIRRLYCNSQVSR